MTNPDGSHQEFDLQDSASGLAESVRDAQERLRGLVRRTPVERAEWLDLGGARIHLKLENQQLSGSFKIRGALNAMLSLGNAERRRGVVAASSGNHGLAVAQARRLTGIEATVVVPVGAATAKVEAIRRLGTEVLVHGADAVLTETYARRLAEERGTIYLSPYNDPRIVAGQGTLGLELDEQCDALDAVYLSVGGGGLAAGLGAALKAVRPAVRVVGCSPRRSAVMARSIESGSLLDVEAQATLSEPTLSDGTAGGVEPGTITFALCRALVDAWRLVEEEQIRGAVLRLLGEGRQLVEGAAGVALAACLADAAIGELEGQEVVVVLCGANLGLETLRGLLCGAAAP